MHLPVAERLRALADPEVRRRLDEGAHSEEAGILRGLANWERLTSSRRSPARTTTRRAARSARSRPPVGDDPFDTLLDIVIADELRTGLSPRPFGDDEADWKMRAEVWRNRDAVIGGSDAGAHLDMMCGAIYTTSLLGHGVREHQVVTLEEAVRLITDVPARLYGLKERGRITPGWHADLVMFDPATVGHGPERTRYDLPAGAPRLVADAQGITLGLGGRCRGVPRRRGDRCDAGHGAAVGPRHRDGHRVMTNRAPLEEFDPAKLQDGLLMAVENVHEKLREAREKHRVMVGNPIIETPAQNLDVAGVTVLGYDECHTVLTDSENFSSSIYEHIMGPVMGRTLLEKEGAEHHSSRALVSPLFRAKLLERWRTELVEVVVHELIDRFAPRGKADLVREFTFAFPVQVIARLMGLPREDYVRFQQLSIELLSVVYNWDIGMAASATLKEYFGEILAERRRDPQDDLISVLAESEIDGERLY